MLTAAPSQAIILSGMLTGGSAFSGGGAFVKLTPPLPNPVGPPNSVGQDNFQSLNVFGFDEDQNITIPSSLSAEVGLSPLPAGTVVASHYVFFDPNQIARAIGTVNFDSNVLAIMTSTQTMGNSDFLANTGVNYLNPTARGLEAGDVVTISGAQQISFDFSAGSPGDYIRVLTQYSPGAVPEPGTWALLGGMAVGGGTLLLRRRKR
jgi:hypothetical protein